MNHRPAAQDVDDRWESTTPRGWHELLTYAQPGHAIARHHLRGMPGADASVPRGAIRCTCAWEGVAAGWGPHVLAATGREPCMVIEFEDGPDADLQVRFDLGVPPRFPEALQVRTTLGDVAGAYVLVGPAAHGPAIIYRWAGMDLGGQHGRRRARDRR